jgi:hypothetical protein
MFGTKWSNRGNLMELDVMITFPPTDDDDGVFIHRPDWEIITRILPYLRRKIALHLFTEDYDYDAEVEDIQGLARRFTVIP